MMNIIITTKIFVSVMRKKKADYKIRNKKNNSFKSHTHTQFIGKFP